MIENKKTAHIVEFRLKASSSDIKAFNVRCDIARKLYNSTLGELLKRDQAMRSDPDWFALSEKNKAIKAKLLNVTTPQEKDRLDTEKKELSKQFSALSQKYLVREYDLNLFSKDNKNACYFKEHLDASTIQKVDARVFDAYARWRFSGFGKPRFKSRFKSFESLEGKSNRQGIRIKLGDPHYPDLRGKTRIEWNGLILPLDLSRPDKHGYQEAALNRIGQNKVKYVRLIQRLYNGSARLYAQIVMEGAPFLKEKHRIAYEQGKNERNALDIGVSTLASYSKHAAKLYLGMDEIYQLYKKLKQYQKKASRSLRLANKDNYTLVHVYAGRVGNIFKEIKAQNPKLSTEQFAQKTQQRCQELGIKYQYKQAWQRKKGTRDLNRPKSYLKAIAVVKELHRKIAAKRKYLHYKYANEIITNGNIILTEKVGIKGWQRLFGKSILAFAPAQLISIIKRKVENTGGRFIEINTRKAKLSQYDHILQMDIKKKLSDRVMMVGGEYEIQRDLYSAFLAYCINKDADKVDQTLADKNWSSARPRLEMAFNQVKVHAKRGGFIPSSAGVKTSCRASAI